MSTTRHGSVKQRPCSLVQRIKSLVGCTHTGADSGSRQIPLAIDHATPLLDARRGRSYVSNKIRTSRYTVWDFVPKQLLFQFSRVGNFYFLCVGIPQMVPGLSTTGSYTTILPLLFFVLLTMIKEGYDDYRRHRLDKVENAKTTAVLGHQPCSRAKSAQQPWRTSWSKHDAQEALDGFAWVSAQWCDVKVGNVVRLSRDEAIPADLVLLHSPDDNGIAYIDTMALDGETNLKTKHVSPCLDMCSSIQGIAHCRATFVVEDPNANLFDFNARVTVGGETAPLTVDNVVYRGSILRNTVFVTGLVVNTGEECKIRINSNQHPRAKRPALETMVNYVVVSLALYILLLSLGVSMGYVKWQHDHEEQAWYLGGASVPFHQIIIAFIIMFNNVVPLSLYISLELVKIGQVILLNSDMEMYHSETDTPARCNTNTILENLGQVGYVFSDKTGTLTDNVMKFRKLSVAGTVWLHTTDILPPHDDLPGSLGLKKPSMAKPCPKHIVTVVQDEAVSPACQPSPPRSSLGARPSSQWQSSGRPDHIQPQLTTSDLVEYLKSRPRSDFATKARSCMLAMALCHTCLPEKRGSKIDFQASSPDELALVRAAQEIGYLVTRRTRQSITLQTQPVDGEQEGKEMTFEILDVIEFSSSRKKMSIIVRYPDGRICLICKGADSTILPRLKLSCLAMQKASEMRKSAELERETLRRMEQQETRDSLSGFGPSPSLRLSLSMRARRTRRLAHEPSVKCSRSKSFEVNKMARSSIDRHPAASAPEPRGMSFDMSKSHVRARAHGHDFGQVSSASHSRFDHVNDAARYTDAEVFTRCFKHLDDFATEGLRTLLYAQKFISEDDYMAWKKTYNDAITSLDDRQQLVEAAADMIEDSLHLVGATAIEDKLQQGVPETVDSLRRANIKIWMLTGDKRETAVNIAHSARICRPVSNLHVIDAAKEQIRPQLSGLMQSIQASTSLHNVVVIDGQSLAIVEQSPQLYKQLFAAMLAVDSVICCRASPAQKALLVRAVGSQLGGFGKNHGRGVTLAIGDGANDIAMIQASHVGIGISGREGLQAARVSDYAIAQFRHLQRLLLVHGRWNYVRTAKFILCTFWKEMFFYLPTAQYQRYNGYTGTSLYHSVSLTVFNTLFTSLCTICMGIWEQDVSADTLLALPELYVYGQRNLGLNVLKYARWMALAVLEGIIVWYGVWAGYGCKSPSARDEGLYALGTLVFTVAILWINCKLLILETHYKPAIVMGSFFITTWGWFAWLAFLDAVIAASPSGAYAVWHSLSHVWGRDVAWWATLFAVLALLGLVELCGKTVRRQLQLNRAWRLQFWIPWACTDAAGNVEECDVELWQEMEQDPAVRRRLCKLARSHVQTGDCESDSDSDDDNGDVDGDGYDDREEGGKRPEASSGNFLIWSSSRMWELAIGNFSTTIAAFTRRAPKQ
ncbi:hypothetical protein CDD82_7310 [Ophiocordyceps australis]|uniref:Phospholipid-transporting ATPase n=1 Tax=Ophiocordyceps australis TaxID=1399860 RepID=A0A2C5YR83_9HYPO|nr:hypothetical protein CDD82_7310 [Ophiocordyceps australis]